MDTLTFLIVDDTISYRNILRQLVQSQPRWIVLAEAVDGIEAIRLVASHVPDVVLMDVNMPRMNGVETTRRIKQLAPQTRVLVLSGYDDEEFCHESLRAGADSFLRKEDVDAERLVRLIQTLLA